MTARTDVVKDAIDASLREADARAITANEMRCQAVEKAGTHADWAANMAAAAQVDALLALRWEIRAATLALGGAFEEIRDAIGSLG